VVDAAAQAPALLQQALRARQRANEAAAEPARKRRRRSISPVIGSLSLLKIGSNACVRIALRQEQAAVVAAEVVSAVVAVVAAAEAELPITSPRIPAARTALRVVFAFPLA
jgi:hypothetical protein